METKDINKVEPSLAKQSRQRVRSRQNSLGFGNKGSYLSGDHLGGCESGQGGDVPECDLDLLGQSLRDEGVPGDGGGDHGVAGQETPQAQTRLLQTCCEAAQAGGRVDGLGGQDVVGLHGDTLGVGQGREVLLGAQEQLDNTRLYHRLCLVDGRTLRDDLR